MKTPTIQKKALTCLVLTAALCVAATGHAEGPVARRPSKELKDLIKKRPSAERTRQRLKDINVVKGNLEITKFEATRIGNEILISGAVKNTSTKALPFSFKVSKRAGGAWTRIQEGGSRFLAGNQTENITFSIAHTNNAMRFLFEINGGGDNQYAFNEFRLNKRNVQFVVKYGTNGDWVLAREFRNDLSNGFDASEFARKELRPRGLDTRIKKTKSQDIDGPFSINTHIHTLLYVHTEGHLRKSFEDRNEAEQFRRELIVRVKDKRLTVEQVREEEI